MTTSVMVKNPVGSTWNVEVIAADYPYPRTAHGLPEYTVLSRLVPGLSYETYATGTRDILVREVARP